MMRLSYKVFAVAALGIAFALPVKAETVVRIATLTSISKAPPVVVAEAKGFFQKHGVQVRSKLFPAGRVLNEGMASGEFDIGLLGDIPGLSLLSQGYPGKIIAAGLGGPAREGILVSAKSNYDSIKDLKGKKVAITKGSTNEMTLEPMLKEAGMNWSDIKTMNLGQAEMPVALALGHVDAVMAWEPGISVMVTKGIGRVLATGEGYIDDNLGVLIASNDILKRDPNAVIKVLRALHEASVYAHKHPDEMVDLLSEKLNLDRPILIEAIPTQWWYIEVFADTFANWQRTSDFLHRIKRIREPLEVKSYTDLSYLGQALGKDYPLKKKAVEVMDYPVVTVKN